MDRPGRPDTASLLSDRFQRTTMSVEQYRDELLLELRRVRGSITTATDTVGIAGALRRVLAAPVTAGIDVPAFDNSGMDGYAVRWSDVSAAPVTLRVVADVPAGSTSNPAIRAGECVRIMTGAPVPDDADTVIQVELTDDGHDEVTIHGIPDAGKGAAVRARGSSVIKGAQLAAAGDLIDGGLLASLTASGVGKVTVHNSPRVAVVSTGDELVEPGAPLRRGQIHDANSLYLSARAAACGATVERLQPLPDNEETFTARLGRVCVNHDLVVITGGASVGDYDVTREVLLRRERSQFRSVAMQPGKPQGWAHWDGALVLALPGNPLSAAVSFRLFVAPLISTLLGNTHAEPQVRAKATSAWTSPPGRRQFVPAALSYDDCGTALVTPVHAHGSASHLTTVLGSADVLAVVPEERTTVVPGTVLDIVELR